MIVLVSLGCDHSEFHPAREAVQPLSVYIERNNGDLIGGIRDATLALNEPKRCYMNLNSDGAPVEIVLFGVEVTESELERISHLDSLRTLYLCDADLNDTAMAHLSNLSNLEVLGVRGNPITDEGLQSITLTNLTQLDLAETAISDASVDFLSSIATLRDLRIWDTRITPAGVAAIGKALPRCIIKDKL